MKNIVFFSTFDPINNKIIDAIQDNNSSDTNYIFYILFSRFSDSKTREEMIKVALKDLGIKYTIRYDFINQVDTIIELKKLLESISNGCISTYSVLILDEKSNLVDAEKICKINGKLNTKENFLDPSFDIRNLKNLDTKKTVIDYIVTHHLYFMSIVENNIKGKRLAHCVSVANTAYDIAISNKLANPDLFYIAGLLHDIGKQYDKKEALMIMEKYYRSYCCMPLWAYHQYTGAFLAKKYFPCINEECINAILTHSSGDSDLTSMQKIIYAADKIEPTRGYDSGDMIEACKKDYNKGFVYVFKTNIDFIENESGGCTSNLLTNKCKKCYLEQ